MSEGGESSEEEGVLVPYDDSIPLPPSGFPSAIDRFYTRFYSVDIDGTPYYDQYIHEHHNKLCVIGVAPTHAMYREGRRVVEVDFQVGRRGRRKKSLLDNEVRGKRKRGGLWLERTSILCEVVCSDGARFPVFACMASFLLEVNENLVNSPHLLEQRADSDGFVAIVSPKFKHMAQLEEEGYLRHTDFVTLRGSDANTEGTGG